MSSVAAVDETVQVHNAMWTSPARLTFHQALDLAEVMARNALGPDLHERISCAMALVKDGAVFQTDDGHTWTVASGTTPGKMYRINGQACTCADAQYRQEKRCKHFISVYLSRKTLELMQAPTAGVAPPTPDTQEASMDDDILDPDDDAWPDEAPALPSHGQAQAPGSSPGQALPEAPASVNVRVVIAGREVQWTLRDTDEDRLATRLEALLARYPVPTPGPSSAPAPAPRVEHGASSGSSLADVTHAVPPGDPQETGWCPEHQLQMKHHKATNGGKDWYSHKIGPGPKDFCRGDTQA